jgi:hypothetical protein
MAAMLSRSGARVFASAAKSGNNANNKPAARVVPKASLNNSPKMFKESGAEAPMAAGASLNFTTTPFDNYKFAPIKEATVSESAWSGEAAPPRLHTPRPTSAPSLTRCRAG